MDIRNVIHNRAIRDFIMDRFSFLPDKVYISLLYWSINGKKLNLKNPSGYNEKIQWLKLHNKNPEYSKLVDKLAVREHVAEKIGEEYLIPLLECWDSADDIDFDRLPNEFVLKCNHDSGSVKLIHDKSALSDDDKNKLRRYYAKKMRRNFFYAGREYPYKGIKRMIIAEQLMHANDNENGDGIKDYKFFCFNGEPKLLLLVSGRYSSVKHEDYFDMDFNRLNITAGFTPSEVCPPKPHCFEQMKEMARLLSRGLCQVRMDFYEIGGKPYFGEYTFFSGGGNELFRPKEWELRLGSWIDLTLSKPNFQNTVSEK